MSVKNAEMFMELASTDEILQNKIKDLFEGEPRSAMAGILCLAAEMGMAFTEEEHRSAIANRSANRRVTELENVSGGMIAISIVGVLS